MVVKNDSIGNQNIEVFLEHIEVLLVQDFLGCLFDWFTWVFKDPSLSDACMLDYTRHVPFMTVRVFVADL